MSNLLKMCQQATPATKEDFIEPTGALRGHERAAQETLYKVPLVDEFMPMGRGLISYIEEAMWSDSGKIGR